MKRFKIYVVALFIVLATPTAFLLYHSWQQLRSKAMLSYKEHALLILQMLNQKIYEDLSIEENRSYSDYRFIKAVPVIGGEEVTLSVLAQYPVQSHYPGMIGHFQLDPDGSIKTPVMPDGALGKIPMEDRVRREALRQKIQDVISTIDVRNAGIFKRVSARKLDLMLDQDVLEKKSVKQSKISKLLREERIFQRRYETSSKKESIVFDVESDIPSAKRAPRPLRHYTNPLDEGFLEVEIDPFQAKVTSKYICYFRNVWRDDQRFIQGFVVNLRAYMSSLVSSELKDPNQENLLSLQFFKADSSLIRYGAKTTAHEVIRSSLAYPLNDLKLVVSIAEMERPPGAEIIILLGVSMLLILSFGMFGLYKVTASQMLMSRKRQDFISAVSHELKTPLTAIRMYGEMLENSWVAPEKQKHYYHLIASESDRLSRLIQNVLNLSNLEKRQWNVNLNLCNPRSFLQEFVDKYRPSLERRQYGLDLEMDSCELDILMDRDALYQVLMNIVENSLKFSKGFEPAKVDIALYNNQGDISIHIRDYGPGVPNDELSSIFKDFYRIENEMTRNTSGTGIGLSLVRHLCEAMNIEVVATNANPGLEIVLYFPETVI